jgi:hypothetical protein
MHSAIVEEGLWRFGGKIKPIPIREGAKYSIAIALRSYFVPFQLPSDSE